MYNKKLFFRLFFKFYLLFRHLFRIAVQKSQFEKFLIQKIKKYFRNKSLIKVNFRTGFVVILCSKLFRKNLQKENISYLKRSFFYK